MKFTSFILLLLFVVIVVWLHITWARMRLKQWAKSNAFQLVESHICLRNIGPFSYFGTSGGQSVFRVRVIDNSGRERNGFARVGGFFFGLMRKRVEVKWDRPLVDELMNSSKPMGH